MRHCASFASFFILALVLAANGVAWAADDAEFSLSPLRQLGVEVEQTAYAMDEGRSPSADMMADFERRFAVWHEAMLASSDTSLKRKFLSVFLLFEKMKGPRTPLSLVRPDIPSRREVAVEIPSAIHGHDCDSAMGIDESHPLRLTIGNSETVWFAINRTRYKRILVQTQSAGPDPELEVYDGCGTHSRQLSANDDAIGLDSRIVVDISPQSPRYVRLTNGGQRGSIIINLQAADVSISGTVIDAQTLSPISFATVGVVNSQELTLGETFTDQFGNYSISIGGAGTYYLIASSSSTVTELFPAGACPAGTNVYTPNGCDFSNSQAITVTDSQSVSNINFALSEGQQVRGEVRDTQNYPLQAGVYLLDTAGNTLLSTSTDAFGHYAFSTLPQGSYKIKAVASHYGSQLYDHVPCGGAVQTVCDPAQGKIISITTSDISAADFNLPLMAAVTGHVAIDDPPYAGFTVVTILDSNGNSVLQTGIDTHGNYVAGPLAPGTYYTYASSGNHFSQLYPNHDCGTTCTTDLALATPITIQFPGQQIEIDFALHSLPSISGHVQDAATGLPLANVNVSLNTFQTYFQQSNIFSFTNDKGDYTIPYAPPGTFYVWAQSDDHVDQVFDAVPCNSFNTGVDPAHCQLSAATTVTVAPGIQPPAFDFMLQPSASISGRAVTRASPQSDLPAHVYIEIVDANDSVQAFASTDDIGNYVLPDLAPGTYFARAYTQFDGSFESQIWSGIDCPATCATTSGKPIALTPGQPVDSVNFSLLRRDAVVGRITDQNGNPIRGIVVDTFASDSGTYLTSGVSDEEGYYFAAVNVGDSYYLATETGGLYFDQVYSDVTCPLGSAYDDLCSLNSGTRIEIPASATQPLQYDFVLAPKDELFQDGFE